VFALLFVFGKVPLTINRCSSCRYVVYMLSFCRLLFFTELYQECKHIMRLHQITDTKLSKPNFRSSLNLSIKSDGLYGWMTCVWFGDVCVVWWRVYGWMTCVWFGGVCMVGWRYLFHVDATDWAVMVDLPCGHGWSRIVAKFDQRHICWKSNDREHNQWTTIVNVV